MPRPLPDQKPTAEGIQYRVQKWMDEGAIDVLDNCGMFGATTETDDGDLIITLFSGQKFKVKVNYSVEVEEYGSQDQA